MFASKKSHINILCVITNGLTLDSKIKTQILSFSWLISGRIISCLRITNDSPHFVHNLSTKYEAIFKYVLFSSCIFLYVRESI